ncbi:hypothetical protein KFZ58_12165 [Virgibacillus sp. NKC19-16]|nr:hypothetical protein KFZ58_12165 [Virgibacillus sp. NKC19-16]
MFSEGDPLEYLYIVHQGNLPIICIRKRAIIAHFKSWRIYGELAETFKQWRD